ncbi:hypothetical protein OAK19_03820 [Aureispira]|nr:hypothetical protein [Aureispira sp.]
MKNFIFFLIAFFFGPSLFAQSNSYAINLTDQNLTSFTEDYGSIVSPESNFTIQGADLLSNGFFIDAIVGLGSQGYVSSYYYGYNTSEIIHETSLRIGSKWYFGSNNKWRPGIQVAWLRIGLVAFLDPALYSPGYSYIGLNIAPCNVGFINTIAFNEKIGLEANLNIGLNSISTLVNDYSGYSYHVMQFGVLINPVIKLRIKKFSVGIDIAYKWAQFGVGWHSSYSPVGISDYITTQTTVSATVGVKF